MSAETEILNVIGGGGGVIGVIAAIVTNIMRIIDKQKSKEDNEKQREELKKYYDRQIFLESVIKSELRHIENMLNDEYSIIKHNYTYPIEVKKANYTLSMGSMIDAEKDFSKSLIVANKVCLRTIQDTISNYERGVIHTQPYQIIESLSVSIYRMYKEVAIGDAGKAAIFQEAIDKLSLVDVKKAIKNIFNYVVNGYNNELYNTESMEQIFFGIEDKPSEN